jgi:transcriptional regulator with XRE-family HTH domain
MSMMKLSTLRLRRFERGLMQAELARLAGIAWYRLSAIENEQVEAQPEELRRIDAILAIRRQPVSPSVREPVRV